MLKITFISVIIILTLSCALTQNNSEIPRHVASFGGTYDNYYTYSGDYGGFDFYYDGNPSTFKQIVIDSLIIDGKISRKRLGFISDMSKRRDHLLENNLYDTGVDSNDEDCSTIMNPDKPHRTPLGNCYFYQTNRTLKRKMNKNNNFKSTYGAKLTNINKIGANNQRFGRNIGAHIVNDYFDKDLYNPSPREISKKLFTRKDKKTIEANTINVLASA